MRELSSYSSAASRKELKVEPDVVAGVVQEVWESLLGIAVAGESPHPPVAHGPGALSGSVEFSGAWHGTVFLSCSSDYARKLAANMFGTHPTSLTTEEVHDALGELVNVIGGNLKHMLPPPCKLQLPAVQGDVGETEAPGQGKVITEVVFNCEAESFRVSLVESSAPLDTEESESRRPTCK